jgi:hypothetical protein
MGSSIAAVPNAASVQSRRWALDVISSKVYGPPGGATCSAQRPGLSRSQPGSQGLAASAWNLVRPAPAWDALRVCEPDEISPAPRPRDRMPWAVQSVG